MEYAYLVGTNGQWRYDIAANTWTLLASNRPAPSHIGAQFNGTTQWTVMGHYVYAILEDHKLYRAAFTADDLVWSGPLVGGYDFGSNADNTAILPHVYTLASVDGALWIMGGAHIIATYDTTLDVVTGYLTSPSTMATGLITRVGLTWDRDDLVYAIEGSDNDGSSTFYVYSITGGTWTQLADLTMAGTLRPVWTIYFAGKVWAANAFGQLLVYDPVGAVWTTITETVTGLPFGALLARLDDEHLLMTDGSTLKSIDSTGITVTTLLAPPTLPTTPNNLNLGFVSVYTIPPVYPFPLSVFPQSVSLPKRFEMVEVPRARGALAVESVYETVEVAFAGMLVTESVDATDLRAVIDATLTWFDAGPILIEVLPDRVAVGYVFENTLDPQHPAVNDLLVHFSFVLRIPSTLFYDYEGFSSHTP